MKKSYDFVFLTNTPSFYKINLCNEIAKQCSLLLVLYGYGSEAVNKELGANNLNFDFIFLHEGDAAKRNKSKTFLRAFSLFRKIKYKKILFSGWMAPEYNILAFLLPKKKNCMLCESTLIESDFSGIKGYIKKKIIARTTTALPSGELHKAIFTAINYQGTVITTGSVGIFHKPGRPQATSTAIPTTPKYLYVGRLIPCKNLEFLIREFNQNGKSLTIIGKGELKTSLKAQAKPNIHFQGFVENNKLGAIYQAHDIFILPSRSETWGLVVEEALYWGLPVIVSSNVGSQKELVTDLNTGAIFQLDDSISFNNAMKEVETNYASYRQNVANIDFEQRDKQQIAAYTQQIK